MSAVTDIHQPICGLAVQTARSTVSRTPTTPHRNMTPAAGSGPHHRSTESRCDLTDQFGTDLAADLLGELQTCGALKLSHATEMRIRRRQDRFPCASHARHPNASLGTTTSSANGSNTLDVRLASVVATSNSVGVTICVDRFHYDGARGRTTKRLVDEPVMVRFAGLAWPGAYAGATPHPVRAAGPTIPCRCRTTK